MKGQMHKSLRATTSFRLLLLTAAILFAGADVSGKGRPDTADITAFNGATIKVRSVSSYKMKVIAQAQLFNFECSMGDAFRIGLGLSADYYLPKFASLHAEYTTAYFNLQKFHASTLAKG